MKNIPADFHNHYVAFLKQHKIADKEIAFYLKWLRFYLNFCHKYSHPESNSGSLLYFIQKLKQKNQSEPQQAQARQAVSLFYKLIASPEKTPPDLDLPLSEKSANKRSPEKVITQSLSETKDSKKPGDITSTPATDELKNQSWKNEFDIMAKEIKLRHYSPKTLKSYSGWVRKFQAFLKSKSPRLLESADAKNYISDLAVGKRVSASTQNQAFNALLFFYRHVLKKEFGDFRDIPRAKRTKYAPSVLSRKEIEAIIHNLEYPYNLVVKLLYGCGLRLHEGGL